MNPMQEYQKDYSELSKNPSYHQIELENEDYYRKRNHPINSPADIFKKLDGFVTLGECEYQLDFEDNIMQNFQLDQGEKDLHLEKIFEVPEEKRHPFNQPQHQPAFRQPAESPIRIEQEQRQQQSHQPQMRYPRKGSNNLPSFPDLLDKMIENFIENFNPNSFQEYNRYQEAMNNIPNFIFLEQNMKYPYVFNNFHGHYLRFIEKMKQYHQQQRFDFKQMISFVCSMGLEFIQDVLNVIKKADSTWCFETMLKHQEQSMPSTQFIINENSTQKSNIQSQMWGPKEQEDQNGLDPALLLNPSESTKKSRKQWTQQELQLINRYIEQYPNSVPQTALQQLCTQLGRTPYSIQSKIHKMKKSPGSEQSQQDQLSVNIPRSNFSSQDNVSISASSSRQGSKKYERPLDDMIRVAINQLPDMKGTKEEIIEKIRQIFFPIQSDQGWVKSVSIMLSSKKSTFLRKIKATYKNQQIPSDQLRYEAGSLKQKLHQILQNFPQQKSEFKHIFQLYLQQEGLQMVDDVQIKTLKKRLNQTLLQSSWFEKTKTYYCLSNNFLFHTNMCDSRMDSN